MELTVEQALQQGIAAHKEGKLQDAEHLYRAILQAQPNHPDANHNLGVLAVAIGKPLDAIPLFKLALKTNPQIEQYWLSYIDALIKLERFDEAKRVLVEGKKSGVSSEKLEVLHQQGRTSPPEDKKDTKLGAAPSQDQLNHLLGHYQANRLEEAEELATLLTQQFPEHAFGWQVLGVVLTQTGRLGESLAPMQSVVKLLPRDAKTHNNLGITLKSLGRLDDAEASYRKAIALKPDYAEAHSNLGSILQELGRLDEAEASHRQAIALRPDLAAAHFNLGITLKALGKLYEAAASYKQAITSEPDLATAHYNLGLTLQGLARLDEAEASYAKAIALKPDHADAYWNLHGTQKTIKGAEHWIDKCLEVDDNYIKARLTKAALRFYQGDRTNFDELMQSEFKQHPYMRSFAWAFSLPNLPPLYFDRWHFFDAIFEKSITTKPFYEFGVWRASSFRYLIKVFKKGYGFDTFSGLPEDWNVGTRIEEKGTYTADGNVPKIEGGEFIVGKFEDTLPIFFSESRPIASVINFDADLYSSTICALNFSKSVMDKDTILIFDELIINENWEHDEFKALNEFCSANDYSYEVIAVSFLTKQVAVKLIGI